MNEIEKTQLQFSGYRLTLLTLDETGPSYIYEQPHPQTVQIQPIWTTEQAVTCGDVIEVKQVCSTRNPFPVL